MKEDKAIEKLIDLTDGKTCMFCTYADSFDVQGSPMSTIKTDKNGHIWFLSDKTAERHDHLVGRSHADLFYMNSDRSYCSVKGEVKVHSDRQSIEELWSPMAGAWFEKGKEDPRVSVLEVIPNEAFYWDTKSNRFVSFLKITAAAATGAEPEIGEKGDLKL